MDGQTLALLVIADILLICVLIFISRGAYNKLRTSIEVDELTSFPNLTKFDELLKKELEEKKEHKYAVLMMKIKGMRIVNEIFGEDESNRLIKYVAESIKSSIGNNIASRMQNNQFIIGYCFSEEKEIHDLIYNITSKLEQYSGNFRPFALYGICVTEEKNETPSDIRSHANMALECVHDNMLMNYKFYSAEIKSTVIREKKLENGMVDALEDEQFVVYFQPKYDIETGVTIGAEALVRWLHPVEGLIPPNAFVPLFEKDGLIIKLDEYVWKHTCMKMREWLDKGYDVKPISVNVSRVNIFDEGLKQKIMDITTEYRIPHDLLELEITESAFLENADELYAAMDYFRRQGFTVSMDDFGSGYSSLNMLKDGNVDNVKIDRAFLNETVTTENGKAVIKSAVSIVKELNMDVIAEGVENEEQAKFLLGIGCKKAQGFFYSRPVDSEEFERKIFLNGR